MEEDLGFVCKLCNIKYPCGKSLGGHMRSHVVPTSAEPFLRENPKKTWRALDSTNSCKQCGHMACHSDHRESKLQVLDSHSHTETEELTKSSPKKVSVKSLNCLSEVDVEDQEEVAMCLMLLSRNSVVESSDNNSVILESIKNKKTSNGIALNAENSDSGYFLDECGKGESESEVSVDDWFRKNGFKQGIGSNYAYTMPHKNSNYQCFDSYKRSNADDHRSPRSDIADNSLDNSTSTNRKSSAKNCSNENKNKAHVCPFCDRVFKNGQALGGHKRSRFITSRHADNWTMKPD